MSVNSFTESQAYAFGEKLGLNIAAIQTVAQEACATEGRQIAKALFEEWIRRTSMPIDSRAIQRIVNYVLEIAEESDTGHERSSVLSASESVSISERQPRQRFLISSSINKFMFSF